MVRFSTAKSAILENTIPENTKSVLFLIPLPHTLHSVLLLKNLERHMLENIKYSGVFLPLGALYLKPKLETVHVSIHDTRIKANAPMYADECTCTRTT